MKKKILKGFTLIELIVVMALMAILMAAIMQLFRPIRITFVDSTVYEDQRTVQSGMVRYITESVRYSTDLGFYTMGSGGVSDVGAAVEAFADEYVNKHSIDSAKQSDVKKAIKKYADVIIIDNDTGYAFGAEDYNGRILRRKFKKDASGADLEITTNAEDASTDECRLALGTAYYGNQDYTVTFDGAVSSGTIADGIGVTVASVANVSLGGNVTVSNSGMALCMNLISIGGVTGNTNAGVNEVGIFHTDKYDSSAASGPGTKVYIVFLNDDARKKVDAVS